MWHDDTCHGDTCHGDTWHDEGQVSWIEISKWVTHDIMRVMCQATKREISEGRGRESMEEKNKEKKKKRGK